MHLACYQTSINFTHPKKPQKILYCSLVFIPNSLQICTIYDITILCFMPFQRYCQDTKQQFQESLLTKFNKSTWKFESAFWIMSPKIILYEFLIDDSTYYCFISIFTVEFVFWLYILYTVMLKQTYKQLIHGVIIRNAKGRIV